MNSNKRYIFTLIQIVKMFCCCLIVFVFCGIGYSPEKFVSIMLLNVFVKDWIYDPTRTYTRPLVISQVVAGITATSITWFLVFAYAITVMSIII